MAELPAVGVYRSVDAAQLPSVQKPDRRRRTEASLRLGEFKIGRLKKASYESPARPTTKIMACLLVQRFLAVSRPAVCLWLLLVAAQAARRL